ncbi:trichohyalin-like [Macrobrachium nipponense]|uniref:trichohyalin-like n=1 Tax=Macrobrachium nipponense TaxID=159736 RepID=UPI0030C7B701
MTGLPGLRAETGIATCLMEDMKETRKQNGQLFEIVNKLIDQRIKEDRQEVEQPPSCRREEKKEGAAVPMGSSEDDETERMEVSTQTPARGGGLERNEERQAPPMDSSLARENALLKEALERERREREEVKKELLVAQEDLRVAQVWLRLDRDQIENQKAEIAGLYEAIERHLTYEGELRKENRELMDLLSQTEGKGAKEEEDSHHQKEDFERKTVSSLGTDEASGPPEESVDLKVEVSTDRKTSEAELEELGADVDDVRWHGGEDDNLEGHESPSQREKSRDRLEGEEEPQIAKKPKRPLVSVDWELVWEWEMTTSDEMTLSERRKVLLFIRKILAGIQSIHALWDLVERCSDRWEKRQQEKAQKKEEKEKKKQEKEEKKRKKKEKKKGKKKGKDNTPTPEPPAVPPDAYDMQDLLYGPQGLGDLPSQYQSVPDPGYGLPVPGPPGEVRDPARIPQPADEGFGFAPVLRPAGEGYPPRVPRPPGERYPPGVPRPPGERYPPGVPRPPGEGYPPGVPRPPGERYPPGVPRPPGEGYPFRVPRPPGEGYPPGVPRPPGERYPPGVPRPPGEGYPFRVPRPPGEGTFPARVPRPAGEGFIPSGVPRPAGERPAHQENHLQKINLFWE